MVQPGGGISARHGKGRFAVRQAIEAVLEERVRPLLRTHGGDVKVLEVRDGEVRFQLLGQCSGCPAADLTGESLVQAELVEHVPGVTSAVLVHPASDELLRQAQDILRLRNGG